MEKRREVDGLRIARRRRERRADGRRRRGGGRLLLTPDRRLRSAGPALLLLHAAARLPRLPRRREHLRVGQRSRVLLVVPVLRGREVVAPVTGVVERIMFRAAALSLASRRGRGRTTTRRHWSTGRAAALIRGAGCAAVPASGLGRSGRRGGPGVNTATGKPAARPTLLLAAFGSSLAVGSVSALISGGRVKGPSASVSRAAPTTASTFTPSTGWVSATASTPAAW